MTVKELIKKLLKLPEEAIVISQGGKLVITLVSSEADCGVYIIKLPRSKVS